MRQILLKIRADGDSARREVAETGAAVEALDKAEAKAEIKADNKQAMREIRDVEFALADVDDETAYAKVELQAKGVVAQIERIEQRLENLSRQPYSPKVDMQIAAEVAKLDRLQAKLAALRDRHIKVDVDAKQALREIHKTEVALDIDDAHARIELEAKGVVAQIEQIKQQLAHLGRQEASPEVDIQIAGEIAKLDRLQAKLASLRDRHIKVNVDVDQSLAGRLSALSTRLRVTAADGDRSRLSLLGLLAASKGASGAASALSSTLGGALKTAFSGLGAGMEAFTGPFGDAISQMKQGGGNAGQAAVALGVMAAVIGTLIVVVTALVGALAALVASLAAAVIAVGALGVAFVGALAPIAGLIAAAASRFSRLKDEAGTAAHALSRAFDGVKSALNRALGPGADAVMRGAAGGLNALKPVISGLRGPFLQLGRAMGGAFERLGNAIASPRIQSGLQELIRGASRLVGPLARGLTALGEIFLNIANAAMPYLVQGAKSFAGWLEQIAQGTRNLDLSTVIEHLSSWWELGKGIFNVFKEFFSVAAGQGKSLVDDLARGAQELAKWIANNPEEIKDFLAAVIPLAKSVVGFIGKLAMVFINIAETAGPALTLMFNLFSGIVGVISKAIAWVNNLGGSFGGVTSVLSGLSPIITAFIGYFRLLVGVVSTVIAAFDRFAAMVVAGVTRAVASAARFAAQFVAKIVGAVDRAIGAASRFVGRFVGRIASAVVRAVAQGARFASQFVSKIASGIDRAVARAASGTSQFVSKIASGVGKAIAQGAKFASQFVAKVASGIAKAVSKAASGASQFASKIASGVSKAIAQAGKFAGQFASKVADGVSKALDAVAGFVGRFVEAGKKLVEGLAQGISSAGGKAIAAAKDVAGKVADLLPGSEPKDHSSPLYGLGKRGEAVVNNFASGIRNATPNAVKAADRMARQAGDAAKARIRGINREIERLQRGLERDRANWREKAQRLKRQGVGVYEDGSYRRGGQSRSIPGSPSDDRSYRILKLRERREQAYERKRKQRERAQERRERVRKRVGDHVRRGGDSTQPSRRDEMKTREGRLDKREAALADRLANLIKQRDLAEGLRTYLDTLAGSTLAQFGEQMTKGLAVELDARLAGSQIAVSPQVAASMQRPSARGQQMADQVTQNFYVTTQGSGNPDPEIALAELARKLRNRGKG